MKITGEQLKQSMIDNNLTRVNIRACSLCNAPIGYIRNGEQLFFDSNCDCTSHTSDLKPRDWNEVAASLNAIMLQSLRIKTLANFGIKE